MLATHPHPNPLRQNFHDILAASLPEYQIKVTVMREPCSRARSLLRHWHAFFPKSHPIQRVRSLDDLASFLEARRTRLSLSCAPSRSLHVCPLTQAALTSRHAQRR